MPCETGAHQQNRIGMRQQTSRIMVPQIQKVFHAAKIRQGDRPTKRRPVKQVAGPERSSSVGPYLIKLITPFVDTF